MMQQPRAEILTIGDELLKGSVLNTNARFLGRELTNLGFEVKAQTACRDSIPAIVFHLESALRDSHLLILSGGLGPTPDDVTRQALAEFFSAPLVFSKSQFAIIQKLYRKRKKPVPSIVRREAEFPANAVPLINEFGIALGFTIQREKQLVVVLPGVPCELEKMFANRVRPLIQRHFQGLSTKPSLVVKMAGISEPDVMKKLGRDFFEDPFDFGIYPETGEVTLRLQADHKAIITRLAKKIRSRLAGVIYAWEETSLAAVVGKLLATKRRTLAVAESCTGGLFASEITSIPGSSRYFKGGFVAYADEIKEGLLEIDATLLRKKGAVSREVASAIAAQIRVKMKSDYGIGITGIAGPSGAAPGKPVGLVYMALISSRWTKCWEENFYGDRAQIQNKAVKKALEYLWREVK